MAYQVLARRWRPRSFDEVVGQDHVTRTLKNAIRSGRLAHGFLFCGPRGVGKTTTARILAKCLNCQLAESGPVVEPCGECATCQEIAAGTSLDVLEIDGASNRGIDEIRELRENVHYAPSGGRAKVYIIDEVHMLTKEAFNALLKTLEEPPNGVYFVFATTEAHRVPATIRSRCQRYDFHRIPSEVIATTLAALVEKEGFEADEEALVELARQADGGLRDAQSLLDQAGAVGGGKVTLAAVRSLFGDLEDDATREILEEVIAGRAGAALMKLQDLLERGLDPARIAVGLTRTLRDLLVVRSVPAEAARLGVRGDAVDALRTLAATLSETKITALLTLSGHAVSDMRRSARPRLTLEVMLARMTHLQDPGELRELAAQIGGMPAPAHSAPSAPPPTAAPPSTPPRAAAPKARPAVPAAPVVEGPPPPAVEPPRAQPPTGSSPRPSKRTPPADEERSEPQPRAASPAGSGGGADSVPAWPHWTDFLERVTQRKPALGSFLEHGAVVAIGEEDLTVVFDNNYFEGMVQRPGNLPIVEEVLTEVSGRRMRLRTRVGVLPAGATPPPGARVQEPARAEARDILEDNPGLNRAIHNLGGRLLSGGDT